MLAGLLKMVSELDEVLAALDPTALHANDAVKLLDASAAIEQRAAAIKTLVADRAVGSTDWTRSGHRTPEDWLAAKTGTSYGQARQTLEASAKLPTLDAVGDALRKGRLSSAQLGVIAEAATPANEQRLLAATKTDGFKQLKERCAKEKAAARSAEQEAARAQRIHRERFFRSWTDADGAYRFEGKTTAAIGARLDAAIAAESEVVFKAAYAEGRRESTAAYRADALLNLVTGGGAGVDATVVIRVDEADLVEGRGPAGDAIGEILAGAFVKVVVTDGIDVTRVAHVGRRLPAELKTAVVERDGGRCVRPRCGSAHRLEVHHYRLDYAKGGPTAYWNLATLCSFDHDLVTYGGHRLAGKPGAWEWIEPP